MWSSIETFHEQNLFSLWWNLWFIIIIVFCWEGGDLHSGTHWWAALGFLNWVSSSEIAVLQGPGSSVVTSVHGANVSLKLELVYWHKSGGEEQESPMLPINAKTASASICHLENRWVPLCALLSKSSDGFIILPSTLGFSAGHWFLCIM